MSLSALFSRYKRGIRYLIAGGLTTVISLGSFMLFDRLLGQDRFLITNVISWILAVQFAFFVNKYWVFESKSSDRRTLLPELLSFFGARLFSLLMEEAGLFLLLDILGMKALGFTLWRFLVTGNDIAKLLMQVIVLILNYLFSRFLIFRRKQPASPENRQ